MKSIYRIVMLVALFGFSLGWEFNARGINAAKFFTNTTRSHCADIVRHHDYINEEVIS